MKNLLTFIIGIIMLVFTSFYSMAQTTKDTVYVLYKDLETQDTITAPKQVPIYIQSRDLRVQDTITSRSYSNGLMSVYRLNFGRHNHLEFETNVQEPFITYEFESDSKEIKKLLHKLLSFDFLSYQNFKLFNSVFIKKNIIYLIDPADITTKSIKFKRAYVSVQEYKRE